MTLGGDSGEDRWVVVGGKKTSIENLKRRLGASASEFDASEKTGESHSRSQRGSSIPVVKKEATALPRQETVGELGSSPASQGLFIGEELDVLREGNGPKGRFFLPTQDLPTHVVVLGTTGSGKTVLGKAIIEEAAVCGIPSILVDLKGDLSSLKCSLPDLSPKSFLPWLERGARLPPETRAQEFSELYAKKFSRFGLTSDSLERFDQRANVVILTPRSSRGVPLSISALPSAPSNITALFDLEPETALELIDTVTRTLISRLYPGEPPEKHRVERKFLSELVAFAWKNEIDLEGKEGLAQLVRLVESPPLKRIGVLELDQYISSRDRHELAININNLLVGAEQLWEIGLPLDIAYLLDLFSMEGKTPVIIVNLNELSHLEDRMFVVSRLSYAIYQWMRKQGGSDSPKLLYYIDEIGGGGGKHAFLPSHPYYPPSKPPLTLLVKQARAFGVCCIFSTQNPGDIDYKALSNCGTWIIGKLPTSRDRGKVFQGLGDAEVLTVDLSRSQLDRMISSLRTGQFMVKTKEGSLHTIQERWLTTFHKTLTPTEVRRLTSDKLRRLALSERPTLFVTKRRYARVRHHPHSKGLKRVMLGADQLQIRDPSVYYKPMLLASGHLRFSGTHPLLDEPVNIGIGYGPFLVPLDSEKVSMSYAAQTLGLEPSTRFLKGLRDEPEQGAATSARVLAVDEAFSQIEETLQPQLRKDLKSGIWDVVSKQLDRKIQEEKLRREPKIEDLNFKMEGLNDQLVSLGIQARQIGQEIANLRSEKRYRESAWRPTVQVTKGINSRLRKLKSMESRSATTERKKDALSKKIQQFKDRLEERCKNLEKQHKEVASKLLERRKMDFGFEEAEEIDLPISSAVLSSDEKREVKIEWNAWNGRRITTVKCKFCDGEIGLETRLGLCYMCGTVACEEHVRSCSECGRYVCSDDSWTCACGKVHCNSETSQSCRQCGGRLCSECVEKCSLCGDEFCPEHIRACSTCKRLVCTTQSWKCTSCGNAFCIEEEQRLCSVCNYPVCTKCHVICGICEKSICKDHVTVCGKCQKTVCSMEDHYANCAVCDSPRCTECLVRCTSCSKPLCGDHVSKCKNCGRLVCQDCLVVKKGFFRTKRKCKVCDK